MSANLSIRHRVAGQLACVVSFLLVTAVLFVSPLSAGKAYAAETDLETWTEVAEEMSSILNDAWEIYQSGDVKAAKARVDDAYYGYYEALGFEKTVMAHISGGRAADVEYQFSFIKRAMEEGDSDGAKASIDTLCAMLLEDGKTLDGGSASPLFALLGSLAIILREGLEAILVLAAIIAYLVKSGNAQHTRTVYIGSVIALAVSVLLAVALTALSAANGANQEIIEGATALVAVLVLFYTSNWMFSKADSRAWKSYIEGKVTTSITKGAIFGLASAAFLAVFREGAETILFYSALLAGSDAASTNMVWLGLGIGLVALVVVFVLIRFLSIKLPIKPFFIASSVLMFILCLSFTGNGIKELQEGGVIQATPIAGVPTIDILGVFPVAETLIPQLVVLAVTVATIIYQVRKWNKGNQGTQGVSGHTQKGEEI
ncbi:MAG: FTR1 family iron permease [Coriobacteriales bacterium]|nr:FTR1 family iron permease [Coriobacteriales bacterium]